MLSGLLIHDAAGSGGGSGGLLGRRQITQRGTVTLPPLARATAKTASGIGLRRILVTRRIRFRRIACSGRSGRAGWGPSLAEVDQAGLSALHPNETGEDTDMVSAVVSLVLGTVWLLVMDILTRKAIALYRAEHKQEDQQ